jgi:hypothetical protein
MTLSSDTMSVRLKVEAEVEADDIMPVSPGGERELR